MNDQSISSSRKEIIETIVFEPFNSDWNQTGIGQGGRQMVPNHQVRLVSFDGPQDLSDKLQEVMISSFRNGNEDNQDVSTGPEINLSAHHKSVSSLSCTQEGSFQDCNDDFDQYCPNHRYNGPLHDGSMDEDDSDWSDFDASNFTCSPTSYQIPVIPEPPIQEFCEQENVKTNQQYKVKPLLQKGIKLDDVLRTRFWGQVFKTVFKGTETHYSPTPGLQRVATSSCLFP